MSSRIKGITIEIGAETTGLDKALKDVNKSSRDIQKELREVDKLLKFNPKDTELVTQKQKLLGDQVSVTKEKLDKLKAAEKQVQDQFKKGDIGEDQYRAFKRELVKTESQLDHYQKKVKETADTHDTLKDKIDNTAKSLGKAGDKMKSMGSGLTLGVTGPIVAGFGFAVEGTREFREELAKLENNAQLVGASLDITKAALKELSIYSDDSGANVEAVSNLLAAGFKDDGLTQIIESLSGAVLKFPDTLKIEGLADGLQETLSTGGATGTFAEMLERTGVELETFNEGLAIAAEKGEEQDYIMQQLAKTGLADVSDAYKKNNKDLVESAEAQYDLKESTAKLGKTLEPIMTKITEAVVGLAESFNNLSPKTQKTILIIGGIAAVVGPVLVVFGTLATAVSAITGIFTAGGIASGVLAGGLALLTSPITLVIAAVAALVAIGVLLFKNWDEIKEAAGALKEKIGEAWGNVKEKTAEAWNNVKEKTSETWNSMKDNVSESVGKMKDKVSETWGNIKDKTAETWGNMKEGTSKAWGFIKGKVDENGGGIKGIMKTYTGAYKDVWEKGFGLIDNITGGKLGDIRDGMKNKLTEMKDAIKNAVSNFIDLFKFDWSLPKPKLPSFSIKGKFSVVPPSVPTIGIKWNAEGAIFNKPYIFGNQGVGEAGPEAVLPIEKLSGILADTLSKMGIQGRQTQETVVVHEHVGTIRVEGVNDRGQMVGVVDAVMDQLRREARTR